MATDISLLDKVCRLYQEEEKWKELFTFNFSSKEEVLEARKLLWVWPSEENLRFMNSIIQELNLAGVTSIGCGCGLFEWLLGKFTGLPTVGFEVNEEWWLSKYSNPQFIKLSFPEQPPRSEMLNHNHALLFCYFNNHEAFQNYINVYQGPLVFVIGPGPGTGRHTDPEPFYALKTPFWSLYKSQEVRESKDFIVAYVRRRQEN